MGSRVTMLGLVLLLASGCAYVVRSPTSGEWALCGLIPTPLWLWPYKAAEAEVFRERQCLDRYEALGFQQVPIP